MYLSSYCFSTSNIDRFSALGMLAPKKSYLFVSKRVRLRESAWEGSWEGGGGMQAGSYAVGTGGRIQGVPLPANDAHTGSRVTICMWYSR